MRSSVLALTWGLAITPALAQQPPSPTGNVVEVYVGALRFNPDAITVHVGDVVKWSNTDFSDHTATATDGSWDVIIPAGGSQRLVAPRPGVFTYICRMHPEMQGTIEIAP